MFYRPPFFQSVLVAGSQLYEFLASGLPHLAKGYKKKGFSKFQRSDKAFLKDL
jgi:hypothetical protein